MQKYARASRVWVRLAQAEGELAFEVGDDGVGFEPERVELGSGLRNLKERLGALGGELELWSRPGQGTRLRGRLPLRQPVATT